MAFVTSHQATLGLVVVLVFLVVVVLVRRVLPRRWRPSPSPNVGMTISQTRQDMARYLLALGRSRNVYVTEVP